MADQVIFGTEEKLTLLFQPDMLLSHQYFASFRTKRLEPEKRLMLAVLEDAVASSLEVGPITSFSTDPWNSFLDRKQATAGLLILTRSLFAPQQAFLTYSIETAGVTGAFQYTKDALFRPPVTPVNAANGQHA